MVASSVLEVGFKPEKPATTRSSANVGSVSPGFPRSRGESETEREYFHRHIRSLAAAATPFLPSGAAGGRTGVIKAVKYFVA